MAAVSAQLLKSPRIAGAILVCCAWGAAAALGQGITLTDVTTETGIAFKHTDGSSGKRYIMETVSAGLATFDYDGDGDEDIYFLNGAPLRGTKVDKPPRNALYRNEGDWKFTDATDESGLGDMGYGLGVAAADYDKDGDLDVFLNNYGPNVLYRNNGDGTFTDVTKKAGVAGRTGDVGAGACFFDMDKDGDLDLYVAYYLEFSYDKPVLTTAKGLPVYPNPGFYPPVPDILYRNNGDGTFTDVSEASGIGAHAGWGMGIVGLDFDNDRDTDVIVGNDVAENFLFLNDGSGKFEEAALISGFAFDGDGNEQASMGVDCGDYDNDGWIDVYVTDYQQKVATLFKNQGDGFLEDVTMMSGAGAGTYQHVNWGNGFADFDNDGDRDLFVAMGHLQDNVEKFDDSTSYLARNLLLMNGGNGKFTDVSDKSGSGMLVKLSSRGAAFDDLDNDGDVDAVILNSRREPTILRNDSATGNHWIQIRLKGAKTAPDGVGARVKVISGDLTQVDEVHSGRGYQSHYGMRLQFGLGKRERVDKIEVQWIGGGTDAVENPGVDRLLTIDEGAWTKPPK